MRPEIILVVAAAENGVIGKDGRMPWHLPADLRHFKQLTVGKPVIMGRRTFESIGKPLPGRHNIVLTRNRDWQAEGATVVSNLAEALAATGLQPDVRAEKIMIIGGADIYAQVMPIATAIELTRIHFSPEGDAFFPAPDPARWQEMSREDYPADGDMPAYSFVRLERIADSV